MRKALIFLLISSFALGLIQAACIDGKWDLDYTWVKDCTPNSPYDGLLGSGTAAQTFSGDTQFTVGSATHTLSWRLHWFKANLPGAPVTKDSLPMVLALHPWTDGASIEQLLGSSESGLMQYEGGWEDVIFLTVALENGNNLNTWWDGSKVNGVPTTWAMDIIVAMLKSRIQDACNLLATAGGTGLAGKRIDVNRVYLVGTSMGGSGTYHIGIRHPELFAAIHANAGFADYNGGPCGIEAFCTSFTNDFIGTSQENLMMKGLDGQSYPARSYSDMSWFVGSHNGASWSASLGKGKKYEPPYILITHGKTDVNVDMGSANRLVEVLKQKKYGYSYNNHTGGHSGDNFLRLPWLFGFRHNRSFPAFSANTTDVKTGAERTNYLDRIGWQNASILDQPDHWEVKLTGSGTVDVTPRRLQQFLIAPNQTFHWWRNVETGNGNAITADANGLLTIPGVLVDSITTLILRSTPGTAIWTGKRNHGLEKLMHEKNVSSAVRFRLNGKVEKRIDLGSRIKD